MQRLRSIILFAVMVASPTGAEPKFPDWPQQPSSFLGIKLGAPLKEQFQECPRLLYVNGSEDQCFTRVTEKFATLRTEKLPDIGVSIERLTLVMVRDSVQGVWLRSEHSDWPRMRKLMIAKYGKPHLSKTLTYTTRGGATLDGEQLTWIGAQTHIELTEYGETLDQSLVTVASERLFQSQEETEKAGIERAKDKL